WEMANQEAADVLVPKDISFEDIVVDLDFHPQKDVIASGLIQGEVFIHSYSTSEKNHELMTLKHHKKACRAVKFSPNGERLFTASKDKSIQMVDLNTGTVVKNIQKAHDEPIYSMLISDENFISSGDDDGNIKVWDMRREGCVFDIKENDDYISDMAIDKHKRFLLATSGDGTLTAFNVRKKKMEMQSELFDSDLLSVSIMKGGEKVICGDGDGSINIFNWGEWGNMSDRFPGHPESIDCMVAISPDVVCTGSVDGIIRAVNILPNRFLGNVGEHDGFPIESLSQSHDCKYVASCSHDQKIKFWNIEEMDKESEKIDVRKKATKKSKEKTLNTAANRDDFFSGFDDNTGDADNKGSDDEESDEYGSDDIEDGDSSDDEEISDNDENSDEDEGNSDDDEANENGVEGK
ncbi:unnamed protein product, partial [Owenia fusiformis]